MTETSRKRPDPRCPLRPSEACGRCYEGVTGPQDCPVVEFIMNDPDLHEAFVERKRATRR